MHPQERSRQVGASLITSTKGWISVMWERVLHCMATIELGQNVAGYGTEYFGKFATYEAAEKMAIKLFSSFEKMRQNREDCPLNQAAIDRILEGDHGGRWVFAIRYYESEYLKSRNTRYPYRLRPFMPILDWRQKIHDLTPH
jgi:hypothetical protein